MKRQAFLFVWTAVGLSLIVFPVFAQAPDSLWSRTFGESGEDACYSMQQTSDGGYILAGSTYSFNVYGDFWLVKADECGNSLWSRTYGGADGDACYSAGKTSDGGYVLAGVTVSFGSGSGDSWLVRTDANGDSLWSRTFGGSDYDYCSCVQQTSDSGYILGGITVSFGAGGYDAWLVKPDVSGNQLWSRTFGGSDYDYCFSMQQTLDGGYILAGLTFSFGAGGDFWLVKTNADGDSLWSRTFGGNNYEDCRSVQQTSDGGYILAGFTFSFGAGDGDFWLVKTNANGDSLWSRTFGGMSGETCYSVRLTSDDGYILAGETWSFGSGFGDFWLVKTNANGDSLWSRTFGGSEYDYCWSAQQTSDDGYVLAGVTHSFDVANGDFWLVRAGFISPDIISITDVGNDQGRQARIRWFRSAYDECPTDYTIMSYSIYRRIDQYLAGGAQKAERESLDWPPGEWEYIKTVPARGEAQYATIVPTLADSTSEGIYWSVFFVSAETLNPLVYFDSDVDSGYSVDNLSPDQTLVTAMVQTSPGRIRLQWQEVTTGGGGQPEQGDIWYRVYGSTDPMFTPGPGNLLGVTQSLEFTHEVGANHKYFYIIQASDDH
jgi:hypothetical protein